MYANAWAQSNSYAQAHTLENWEGWRHLSELEEEKDQASVY